MAVHGQCVTLSSEYGGDDLRVEQDITIRQQELTTLGEGASEPQREDIVIMCVIGVINKMNCQRWIVGRQEVTNHLSLIASHDHQLVDTSLHHGIHRTLKQRTLANGQQTFGTLVCQRAQTLSHAGSQDYAQFTILGLSLHCAIHYLIK